MKYAQTQWIKGRVFHHTSDEKNARFLTLAEMMLKHARVFHRIGGEICANTTEKECVFHHTSDEKLVLMMKNTHVYIVTGMMQNTHSYISYLGVFHHLYDE